MNARFSDPLGVVTGAALAASALAIGCGGERHFEAEEFITAANDQGAGFVLGTPLSTSLPDREIYVLELSAQAASGTPVGGGGSVVITENEETGRAEHARCESAATLLCYRASNVVVELEDALTPDSRRRVDEAFSGLARE
ncbi:MAG: hypothetical protein ACR2OC_05180 [Solirubrobacterales bacterium]